MAKVVSRLRLWIAQRAGKGDDAKINAGYDKQDRVLIREFRGMAFEEAKLPEIIKDRLQVGSIHDETAEGGSVPVNLKKW